ncbi:MAG: hypothetical protein JRJ38_18875 [Deltaproteobacteria bacterium]|nr:hypothetical protein [Deltaproteobacteria bacterium]
MAERYRQRKVLDWKLEEIRDYANQIDEKWQLLTDSWRTGPVSPRWCT